MMLPSYVSGQWREGAGAGDPLVDPVTGDELARVSSQDIDVPAALEFARSRGGAALRQSTYRERAQLLAKIAEALAANRDEYFRLSLLNSGATQADASFTQYFIVTARESCWPMSAMLHDGRARATCATSSRSTQSRSVP